MRQLGILIRIRSCIAGAVVCSVGFRIGGGESLSKAVLACFVVASAIAFAQVDNDIADRNLDRYDKPQRPLPSAHVSLRAAEGLALTCGSLSILAAAFLGLPMAMWSTLVLMLSWVYSRFLKSTVLLGNIVVALLASSTVPYGSLASGGQFSVYLLVVQLMVFSVVLAHEVVKTIRDVRGDSAAGVKTIATKFGVRRSSYYAAGLVLISVAISITPVFFAPRPAIYLGIACIGLILPSLVAAWRLATTVQDVSQIAVPFQLLRIAWGGMVIALLFL